MHYLKYFEKLPSPQWIIGLDLLKLDIILTFHSNAGYKKQLNRHVTSSSEQQNLLSQFLTMVRLIFMA
jgi:hypothetical protein